MALKQVIIDHVDLIQRTLHPSNNLFIKLRSVEVIKENLCSIEQQPTVDEKIDALLKALLNVRDDLQESVMNGFVAALRHSGQDHVANIFRPESDKVPMSDEHYKILVEKRFRLSQIIVPNDGLVDLLHSSGIFSNADRTAVLNKPQTEDMADETLNIFLRKPDCAFDNFVDALSKSGQSHVAYLLTGVGRPPMSDQHRELLVTNMKELCKFVDVENGLLDSLFSQKVISLIEAERVRSVPGNNQMAQKLVTTLLRKHDDAFHDFVSALNDNGQKHVAFILTAEGDSRPMKNELRDTLLATHRDRVVGMMDSKKSGIVSSLMSKGVFTEHDEGRVVNVIPNTTDNENEIILNLVARKSQSAYFDFISALNDTYQTHVVVELIGVEVTAKIKALCDSEGANGNTVLPDVDAELLQYMRDMFDSNGTVVRRLNEIFSQNGVAVSDVREGCIQITFACKTLESLKNLRELYKLGKLNDLLNEAFCPQFVDKGLESLKIEISDVQFQNCEKMFSCWTPMTSVHRNALKSSTEWLAEKLIISHELLDELSLCKRRRQAIEQAETRAEQAKTLLEVVSRQPDSAFKQLLNALNCTQQQEIAESLSWETQIIAVRLHIGLYASDDYCLCTERY